jgi:hypothetical protein
MNNMMKKAHNIHLIYMSTKWLIKNKLCDSGTSLAVVELRLQQVFLRAVPERLSRMPSASMPM